MWWFGAVKYAVSVNYRSRMLLFIKLVTISAWSKPSENCCLHCLSKCIPKDRREGRRNGNHSPHPSVQASRTQKTTQAGLFKRRLSMQPQHEGEWWWEEFWPRQTKFPQGLVFQPSSSARSNISCTIVPSVARPKPRNSSAAEIRIESKFWSWGQGESLIYIRLVLGHVC